MGFIFLLVVVLVAVWVVVRCAGCLRVFSDFVVVLRFAVVWLFWDLGFCCGCGVLPASGWWCFTVWCLNFTVALSTCFGFSGFRVDWLLVV